MTAGRATGRTRALILALHLAALLGGLLWAWLQWSGVASGQVALDQAKVTAGQLDARLTARSNARAAAPASPVADPFLPGASATVASANLQARVVSAIRGAGGSVTSTDIDTTGASATPATLLLAVSCQVPDAELQGLLYGLEAGTPALFIDRLSIDAAAPDAGAPGAPGAGSLKVTMTVSGFWNGDGRS